MKRIDGDVTLLGLAFKEIPVQLKGITINGNFDISTNRISSLQNSPEIVNGKFNCTHNKNLTSLIGGPKQVVRIYTHFCNLTNLEGLPSFIGGVNVLDVSYNRLLSLNGMPEKLNGHVYIDNNPTLTSLKGCTQEIAGDFIANEIPIKTLEGGPKTVNGSVQLIRTNLETLDGLPSYIGGYLLVGDTPIGKKLFPSGSTKEELDIAINLYKEITSKSKILLGIYEFEEDAEEELADKDDNGDYDDGDYPEYEDEER